MLLAPRTLLDHDPGDILVQRGGVVVVHDAQGYHGYAGALDPVGAGQVNEKENR